MAPDASVVEAVAKYLFFLSLDDQASFSASLKVLAELNSRNWMDSGHRAKWVAVLHRWKAKLKAVQPRGWIEVAPAQRAGFVLPPDFNLSVWASFLAAADAGECEAVLLSRILNFSDQEIAQGLGVSEGTVRYRVGRGLRHLGGFIEP